MVLFPSVAALGLLAASAVATSVNPSQEVFGKAYDNLQAAAAPSAARFGSHGRPPHGGPSHEGQRCSLWTANQRKDWAHMCADERKEYIRAVQCLMAAPSKADPAFAPGARTRYDDFVAVHINQTLSIHGTGNFLSWHRYFVYSYETALRNECGYDGYQPYWNWFTHQADPRKSPVFDGSETSMSGDGAYVAHNGSWGAAGKIFLPSGRGGGCLTGGPFRDMVVNLGPVAPTMDGQPKVGSPLEHNPRCLRRDLSAYTATRWLTAENLLNITVGAASSYAGVRGFQDELQGRFDQGFLGLHASGHFVINGDGGDLYSSPVDPVFWLHHAQLDRVWWAWQALHPRSARDVAGTITLFNQPPSRNTTKDDLIDLGVNAEPRRIGDLLDTLDDGLCYVYV